MFDVTFAGGKLQVAKVDVSMYGKYINLVKWPTQY